MIHVKGTILKSIKLWISKLRKLAINDPKVFKKILYLIILDDLYEWGNFIEEDTCVLEELANFREKFILCNPELEIQRITTGKIYSNVNTPQSNDSWKRVWDAPEIVIIEKEKIKEITNKSWTPDPSVTPQIIYYIGEGEPDMDINNLTVAEKMDVYINREDGSAYYLDYDGSWKQLKVSGGVTEEDCLKLIEERKQGIEIQYSKNTVKNVLTDHKEDYSQIKIMTKEEVEELL